VAGYHVNGVSWAAFAAEAPGIAAAGERLLRPTDDGIAFLSTVRKDGGPRVHPVMPVVANGALHVFVVTMSYKYRDLLRDSRYALHAMPTAEGGEEFYITARAWPVHDPGRRQAVRAASGDRLGGHDFEALFALDLEAALHTKWENWGTARTWPAYNKWKPVGAR
jgi:hypothetical protein